MSLMKVHIATKGSLFLGHIILHIQWCLKCLWLIEMMYETSTFPNRKTVYSLKDLENNHALFNM